MTKAELFVYMLMPGLICFIIALLYLLYRKYESKFSHNFIKYICFINLIYLLLAAALLRCFFNEYTSLGLNTAFKGILFIIIIMSSLLFTILILP